MFHKKGPKAEKNENAPGELGGREAEVLTASWALERV